MVIAWLLAGCSPVEGAPAPAPDPVDWPGDGCEPGPEVVCPDESPSFEEPVLAGIIVYWVQGSVDGYAEYFSQAAFQEPAPMRVAEGMLRPEHCQAAGYVDVDRIEGGRDLGSTLALAVGADSILLARDTTWVPGETWYTYDDFVMASEDTAGRMLSFEGTSTGVEVPRTDVTPPPDDAFWAEVRSTGTLRLRWTPTGSDFIAVEVQASREDSVDWFCSLEDDGIADVMLGPDTGHAILTVVFAPTNRGIAFLPGIGDVEVIAQAPRGFHPELGDY